MRRLIPVASVTFLLALTLAACSQNKTADVAATSDSLMASNPVEQPAGDITPQSQYTEPKPDATPAATTPATKTTPPAHKPATKTPAPAPAANPGTRVDAGTAISVSVASQISSETANVGDTWTGEVKENVIVGDRVVFPAGSTVSGTITEAVPAKSGSLARLGVEVNAITVNGTRHAVDAGTEAIEAGSPRARNLGAIAVGAGAGALIGKAVGGGGKGALIGGLLGAGAAGAGVAKSKGYQVVLKEGTVVTFNVKQPVTIHS